MVNDGSSDEISMDIEEYFNNDFEMEEKYRKEWMISSNALIKIIQKEYMNGY